MINVNNLSIEHVELTNNRKDIGKVIYKDNYKDINPAVVADARAVIEILTECFEKGVSVDDYEEFIDIVEYVGYDAYCYIAGDLIIDPQCYMYLAYCVYWNVDEDFTFDDVYDLIVGGITKQYNERMFYDHIKNAVDNIEQSEYDIEADNLTYLNHCCDLDIARGLGI